MALGRTAGWIIGIDTEAEVMRRFHFLHDPRHAGLLYPDNCSYPHETVGCRIVHMTSDAARFQHISSIVIRL